MKRIYIAFTIAFFLSISGKIYAQNGQNQWKHIANIPEDSIGSAQFLFTDSLHGYLYGFKINWYLSYKNAILYRTNDGGYTWQKIDFHNVFGPDTLMYDGGYSYEFDANMFVTSSNTVMFTNEVSPLSGTPNDTLTYYWSDNSGDSWQRYRTQPLTSRLKYKTEAVSHDHEVIALNVDDLFPELNNGKFSISETNGASFDDIRWDSTLIKNLSLGGFGAQGRFNSVNDHSFDYFDDTTWIINVADSNNTEAPDSTKPFSLVTLLSHDAGHSWKAYRNILPHFPSFDGTGVNMQCVKGTSYVYLFSGLGSEGGGVYVNYNFYGFPYYGVNYLYSSDYGITWKEVTAFGTNRLGYEPAAPGDVWCTATAHDSVSQTTPASWIVHTTNDGATWNIDSLSLTNDGYYDARIVTFSGKNNGWIYAQPLDRKEIAIFKYNGTDAAVNDNLAVTDIPYTIYPNPSSNETSIQFTNNFKIARVEVFDILGRKWICPYEISEESLAHLHTEGLNSGCYFARMVTQNGSYMVRFFVQH